MKQGTYRLFFGVSAVILVLLYLMSSTNLIIREKKTEIYPISVIVEDSSDEDYEKLRKGMDRAAQELHVDLNFITLYQPNDQNQQLGLIAREISDGAKAVILSPANPVEAMAGLDEMVLNSPLIILGNIFPHAQAAAGISIDYMEAGRLLGEAVRENHKNVSVHLLTKGLEYGYARELYDGIYQVLSAFGYPLSVAVLDTEKDGTWLEEEADFLHTQNGVMIALDESSLEEAAKILEENESSGGPKPELYGIGGTNRILNYLDKGIIQGLVVHNWFDEGYLSVEKAVEAIQGGGNLKEQTNMKAYYITKEDLRNPVYEKMLYPID